MKRGHLCAYTRTRLRPFHTAQARGLGYTNLGLPSRLHGGRRERGNGHPSTHIHKHMAHNTGAPQQRTNGQRKSDNAGSARGARGVAPPPSGRAVRLEHSSLTRTRENRPQRQPGARQRKVMTHDPGQPKAGQTGNPRACPLQYQKNKHPRYWGASTAR